MKIPRKCDNHEAQPFRGTKGRRDKEEIRTTQTPHMKSQTHQQRNLALKCNSDVVTINKYTYMICSHRSPLPHLWNITVKHIYNQIHCDTTKQGLKCILKPDHKKSTSRTTTSQATDINLMVKHRLFETDWGESRQLVRVLSHCCGIKVGSKAINLDWISPACSWP